jgi:propionyl-CoA carboxylase alpha chain
MSTTPAFPGRSIDALLIANRGEIAVRIARTAHRLGISTVGVYSETDRHALHVDAVDVAVALGGSTPAESYLRGDAIIAAARATGATAVHPGYGFLAENADFAEAVLDAGLVWVGPTPDQIRLLGDKIAAKRAAADAGVPTTPVVEVVDGEPAPDVAFPALVKAAAGGGGRGMRVVRDRDELAESIESAAREAASAFGDGTVFIEPYIEHGRHVEVQIFGDAHGNVVHLGDRECSIQRRNQKIVEEAPSPGLDEPTRRRLHEGAVALAHHVGYVGAGTVEFMVGDPVAGGEPTVTFLEVNTRLQVEHPATEAVTGLDLVELQLLVAEGRPLPIAQDDVVVTGHAIEVRIVAEDPVAGWLPSTGTITELSIDELDGLIRVDPGFHAGGVVSADYDSLLAKVITHDADRRIAARRLARALRSARVDGVRTNLATLAAILDEPDFAAGRTPTSYLDDHPAVVTAASVPPARREAQFLAAVFALEHANRQQDGVTGFAPSGWRNLRTRGQRRTLVLDADGSSLHTEYTIAVSDAAAVTAVDVRIGEPPTPDADGALPPDERPRLQVRLLDRADDRQVVEIDGVRHDVATSIRRDAAGAPVGVSTADASGATTWTIPPRFVDHDAAAEGSGPVSPLPGTVIAVHVAAGDAVAEGQLLMVVEAMKMEHKITAPIEATVTEVRYAVGDRVDSGDLLVGLHLHGPGEEGES